MGRQTLGLRERKAGKRRRRGSVTTFVRIGDAAAVAVTLKSGRKHFKRIDRRAHDLAVAESEKLANGAPENC